MKNKPSETFNDSTENTVRLLDSLLVEKMLLINLIN